MPISNKDLQNYDFLGAMYRDSYFPDHLVDKAKAILVRLCERIEHERPEDVDALYILTHAATEELNQLVEEFDEAGSDIETAAREALGDAFDRIAKAYGFEADVEELIAPRDW